MHTNLTPRQQRIRYLTEEDAGHAIPVVLLHVLLAEGAVLLSLFST